MKSSQQGGSNGIHVQAEGPAGSTGSDGPEALGSSLRHSYGGRNGVAGVEEPWPSWALAGVLAMRPNLGWGSGWGAGGSGQGGWLVCSSRASRKDAALG